MPTYLAVTKDPPFWPVYVFLGLVVIGFYLIVAEQQRRWPYRVLPLNLQVSLIKPEQVPKPTPGGVPSVAAAPWRLALRVRNQGSSGTFAVSTAYPIYGVDDSGNRARRLVWDGTPEPSVRIFGDGHSRVLVKVGSLWSAGR